MNDSAGTAASIPYKQEKYIKQTIEGCWWKPAIPAPSRAHRSSTLRQRYESVSIAVQIPWASIFWIQTCRLYRAAQLSILQVTEWVVRKSSTSSTCITTLLYLLPGAHAIAAAVCSCRGAMERCNKQLCGRYRQSPPQLATGELQHFCRWLLTFLCIVFKSPSSILWVFPS